MQNPLKGKFDIGVIVGRFQVPELSKGHTHIIDNVIESHKKILIIAGVSQTLGTKNNPLNYSMRLQMIQEKYPETLISHLLDVSSDDIWSKNLDILIRSMYPMGSICIYGGRDSFQKHYTGVYDTFEIGTTDCKEGTKIRQDVGDTIIDSYDFRSGMIYQSQNQYSKVFPTVDIAVIKNNQVLLGRRTTTSALRFPGGFVDPIDKNIEECALRELYEEFDVEVDFDSIKYVGSNLQNDWRYNSPNEKIMTSLYKVNYIYGGTVKDEFYSVEWVTIGHNQLTKIEDSHKKLFELLINDKPKKRRVK